MFCPATQLLCVWSQTFPPKGLHTYPATRLMCSSQVFHCPPSVEKTHTVSIHPPCEGKINPDCYLGSTSEFGEKFEKWVQFQWIPVLKTALGSFMNSLQKNVYSFIGFAKYILLNEAVTLHPSDGLFLSRLNG